MAGMSGPAPADCSASQPSAEECWLSDRAADEGLVQMHARCCAAESRARVLERQLQAAIEVIDTLELQSGDRNTGLRGKFNQLTATAQRSASAEHLRLCSQLAASHAENQRLSRELGAAVEREKSARAEAAREQRRSSAVLKSSLESASHARSTMEQQRGVVDEARAAHAGELQRLEERIAASEVLRAKAEAEAGAKEQNIQRLMALVQQHERRHAQEKQAVEQADLERLKMQRALSEMADQLDVLQARADAAATAKAAEAAKLAKATLPQRGGPKRAVLSRRQQQADKASQPTRSQKSVGSRGRGS